MRRGPIGTRGQSTLQDNVSPQGEGGKPDPHEEERDRRAANIFLLVAAIVLIGSGIWLADAMVKAKRADDCLSAGRRNCSPIEVPRWWQRPRQD